MDMMRAYRLVNASVDITAIGLTPPAAVRNYRAIFPEDINDETWADLEERSFDFIRMAFLCGKVSDWSRLFRTAFR